MQLICIIRTEVSVTARSVCYMTEDSDTVPPLLSPNHQALVGSVNQSTGMWQTPLMPCMNFFGFFAVGASMSVQLGKSGGAASGTAIEVEDVASPLDCGNGGQASGPLTLTPLASNHNEDGDDCTDYQELGSNQAGGGLRDPFNPWDFFNANKSINKTIDVDDIFFVADPSRIFTVVGQPGYTQNADRDWPALGPGGWNLGPPDGVIDLDDITAVAASFGHTCL